MLISNNVLAQGGGAPESQSFHQVIKDKFIEGDPLWMSPILLCFIFGLAIVIERILTIIAAQGNSSSILNAVVEHLREGKVASALTYLEGKSDYFSEFARTVVSNFSREIDVIEKEAESRAGLMVSRLESGLPWITLFISLSPLLGFLGTVVGMVMAFDVIAKANTISPAIVAHGIAVALLTTLAGLIVAIILQVCYNYIISRIEAIVHELDSFAADLLSEVRKVKLSKVTNE